MLKLPVTKDKCPFDPLDCGMAVWHNLVQLSRALELLMAELGDTEGSLMDPAMRDRATVLECNIYLQSEGVLERSFPDRKI